MMWFWALSALLVVIAWWFVVRPLLARRENEVASHSRINVEVYRDQLRELDADLQAGTIAAEQHGKARREIEARLLQDVAGGADAHTVMRPSRVAAAVVAVVVPLCAFGVYLMVGTPEALAPRDMAAGGQPHAADMKQLESAVEKLAARLKDNPDNTEGWVMLGRSYRMFGRFAEAAQAFARAVEREPRDANLLADYADMLAMAQDRRLQGDPEKLIARALEADPQHLKALALAGSAAFEKKDYAQAIAYWERMLPLLPAESEDARGVQASIAEARSLGGAGLAQAAPVATPLAARSGVSGTVTLAPALAGRIAPTDTVFIFARPAEGARMPLAIVRRQARELPIAFTLDDTMSMSPDMTLSKFAQVVVGARISKSSSANPQPGDFEGVSAPVSNTAAGVTVTIANETR